MKDKARKSDLDLCEELLRQGKKDCPDVLYKYLGVNGSKLTLKGGKLRFTPPNLLNDLFECLPASVARGRKLSKKEVGEYLACQYEANPARFKVPPQIAEEQLTKWRSGNVTAEEIAVVRKMVCSRKFLESNGISKAMSILSLSSCPDNILMWGHYAENGKGLVLGLRKSLLPSPVQVKYRKKRIRFDLKKKLTSTYRIISTKFKGWEYECEWRIVAQNDKLYEKDKEKGIYLYTMPEDLIDCIILGPKTSRGLKALARNFARQKGCCIKKAKVDPSSYKIDITADKEKSRAVKPEE